MEFFCDFVSVSNASSYSSSFFVKIAIFMVIQLSYVIPPFSETPETPFTNQTAALKGPTFQRSISEGWAR
jgi:hypothetical protein